MDLGALHWASRASRAALPRRFRARLRRWLYGGTAIYHHPTYRLPLASSVGAPMSPRRADDALTWLIDGGIVGLDQIVAPEELSYRDAALVHADAYLARLDDPEVVARILGADAARVPVRHIVETWRRASWGTADAARRVTRDRRTRRAVNLFGGFHHAEPDRGGGFCAFNDVAIAVAKVRRAGLSGRIAVIDLDVHPPDGIVACLGDDPDLVVRSLSSRSEWAVPDARRASVTDARLPAGTTDAPYLAALDDLLADLRDARPPLALAFYLAGADVLARDRIGTFDLTLDGLLERDRRVFAALGSVPTVVLPAGGYAEDSWRALAGTATLAARSTRRVPARYDPLTVRTRRVQAALNPAELGAPDDDEVLITAEELYGGLGAAPTRTRDDRFLGYYTRHGLEHALTAYGYLDTLQRLGFAGLALHTEHGQDEGNDRMRITALIDGERAPIVDISVSLRPIDTYKTLFVEWMELTDPRSRFSRDRPKLPGQRHPGLGLADDTTQLLVRAAERLGLDGVAFIPSHYHVAYMCRRQFAIVDPEERGLCRALFRVLADVPLLAATRTLGGRGLPTVDGERIVWTPPQMALALTDAFRDHLKAAEAAAAEAEARWMERLLPWPAEAEAGG